ncbi:SLOG family protein [Bacillus sp. NPDC094106]|uniref:SLOG family protein n=1 Tax=Bacillus sp. NPDC094106 TaxID=3363949 RepID=UPI00382F994A
MIIVVTGHRPKKLGNIYDIYHPMYVSIGREMREFILNQIELLEEGEILRLVTGMALGIDTVFALVALKLKEKFPKKIILHCALPCAGQEEQWSKPDQERYDQILGKADEIVMVSKEKYKGKKTMFDRDEYMVDMLAVERGHLLAVWNGIPNGGTYHTMEYAQKKGATIHTISPNQHVQ